MMENLFSCISIKVPPIATNFCTCHDSTAVVACAKLCDRFVKIEIKAKLNFHHDGIGEMGPEAGKFLTRSHCVIWGQQWPTWPWLDCFTISLHSPSTNLLTTGQCYGTVVAFEKLWEFPPVTLIPQCIVYYPEFRYPPSIFTRDHCVYAPSQRDGVAL